jgi:hypothetical protein
MHRASDGPAGSGGEGLDVDEDDIVALQRLDEAEASFIVPAGESAVEPHESRSRHG